MLEEVAKDFTAYFKVDVSREFQTVQDVIDNMLTRLEELSSVLQMVKLKNNDCNSTVFEEISKYRSEITTLSRKIAIINDFVLMLQSNVDTLEKQVEKAEIDFGISNDNKLKSFLLPLLKRNREIVPITVIKPSEKLQFQSVLDNFVNKQND